jgi:hypothetical protein
MVKVLRKGDNINFNFICASCDKRIIMTRNATVFFDESTGEVFIVHSGDCYHSLLKEKGDRFDSWAFFLFFRNLVQGFGDIASKF